nr:hypothetical protein [Tanacetum cinerariifolium]
MGPIHEVEVQLDDCDAFDFDVDEAPTTETMFMVNLSYEDPVYDAAGPSYDSNILSEHALYNGHEIIKDNHVPTIVHNTEDTLEIAEITRRKMNDKMKDPECVNHKVKIEPHDYLKKNFLATFTPQKQLTPEQIFWSQDLIKMKTEALKEQTTASRPIKALMVYPPNTPATLVPRRITPTVLTEEEKGFKQTKECYLKEVIPFFKTLKEHFKGIQRALTKEIKEMKDVFEELKDEIAQNVVDRKHDDIERKNLLIANDNLIVECLSKEVFFVATNSELNVARFTKMHVTHTIVEARCLELEAELSNLRGKSHIDNHNELVNRFSNLEDAHLDYLRHLKESVETIRDTVEEAKVVRPLDSSIVSTCRYTKHSQELLDYAIGTCPQDSHQRDKKHAPSPLIRKKRNWSFNTMRFQHCPSSLDESTVSSFDNTVLL